MPITKTPKAKPIKKPNPVAKASQKVTSGSGRHASKKDFKRQSKHQKAIDEFANKVPEQYKPLFKAFPKETMKLLLTPKEPSLTALEVKALEKLEQDYH